MHPKLKAFMRTEAMECDVATSQAPTSDAAGNAIENASEPQEMAATLAATVAATPSDIIGQGVTQARLPEETESQGAEVVKATQGEAPKLRRLQSRNSKKSDDGQTGEDNVCDTDEDEEEMWCSKGIAVFLSPEEEAEQNRKTEDAENMEVDPSRRLSETEAPAQRESKSMMACFKHKPKPSSSPLHRTDARSIDLPSDMSFVPSTISSTLSSSTHSLPISLASKSTSSPSIPHTFVPTTDVDMDTGESTALGLDGERDKLKKCTQFIKVEEEEARKECHVPMRSIPNGCLIGNAPLYAPNPFTFMGSLPLIVKTEPGLSPSAMTHPSTSPLTGQSFISQMTGRSNGIFDFAGPIASLPPMDPLHCMQLEELMRMNFSSLAAIKHDGSSRVLSLHGHRAQNFFQKQESKTPANSNGAKMFTCQQCGATFKHRHHVVRHMRAHTGEKPFRCEECGAMFARKCILTNHIRTHTGEKPYVCGECGDAFSRKHHLVIHRRTHTGEKPYVCSVCSTAFARSHHLNRHLKTHILMQQGQLNGMALHTEGALDLSPRDKLPEHIGAVDLSPHKAFIPAKGLPRTEPIVTSTAPHVTKAGAL